MAEYQQHNDPLQQNGWEQHLHDTADNCDYNTNFENPRTMKERKIYVGYIDKNTTEKDLVEHFKQFGEISKITLKIPIAFNRQAFAFILFKDSKAVSKVLACKNHVINNKTVTSRRALSRHYKLYIRGLSPNLYFSDIKNYFKRFTTNLYVKIPYDYAKRVRKDFGFISFDNPQIIDDILSASPHVINGTKVEVEKIQKRNRYDTKTYENLRKTPSNMYDDEDFLPQNSYVVQAPYYVNIGYNPYNQFSPYGYQCPYYGYPYLYYDYPSYDTYTAADYQNEYYEPFMTDDTLSEITEDRDYNYEYYEPIEIVEEVSENIIEKDIPEMEPVKDEVE